MDLPHLMTTREYSELMHCSLDHVRFLIRIGDLAGFRVHLPGIMKCKYRIVPHGFDWSALPAIMSVEEAASVVAVEVNDLEYLMIPVFIPEPGERCVLRIDLQAAVERLVDQEE